MVGWQLPYYPRLIYYTSIVSFPPTTQKLSMANMIVICLPLTYVFKFALLQLDEISSRNNLRQSWEGGEQSMSYGPQNAQSQRFFQPLDCNPTLQIG